METTDAGMELGMAPYGGCVSVRKTISTYLCSSIGARAAAAAGIS